MLFSKLIGNLSLPTFSKFHIALEFQSINRQSKSDDFLAQYTSSINIMIQEAIF